MTRPRSAEDRIAIWLEEEATGFLPDRVLDATFERTRGLRQARRSAWRLFSMTRPIPALIAVGAAAIIIAGVVYIRLSPTSNGGGSLPGPSPTMSAEPTITPTESPLDTATWTTYVSDRYGFSMAHPADWTEVPGDHDWTMSKDIDWLNTAAEVFFTAVDEGVRVSAWSVPYSDDRLASWIEAYCAEQYAPCSGVTSAAHPVSMDGHEGLLIRFTHDTQAFFQVDGRIYAVAVWWPDSDPAVQRYGGSRRLLEAFISTMRLLPGGPAPESPNPSST